MGNDVWIGFEASILYGSKDYTCEFDVVSVFAKCFHYDLEVLEHEDPEGEDKEILDLYNKLLEKNNSYGKIF